MRLLKLLAAFILSFAAGAIGSLATTKNIPTWYAGLDKPFFNPPNMVFGPVWTALYALMAVSLYLIWIRRPNDRRGYYWFAAQIILNAVWSLVFFGAHQLWLAVAVIALLIIAIIKTMREFWFTYTWAAYILAPYLIWVSFAAVLNVSIALLNT